VERQDRGDDGREANGDVDGVVNEEHCRKEGTR
jgi:hypothetical protein